MKHSEPSFGKYLASTSGNSVMRQIDAYLATNDSTTIEHRDITVHQALLHNGSDEGLYTAGAIALDLASRPDVEPDERADWLAVAHQDWREVLDKSVTMHNMSSFAIKSALDLAALPSYASILLHGRLPDEPARRTMYAGLYETAGVLLDYKKREHDANRVYNAKEAVGIMAELAILMLHQRWTLENLDDGSQLALPSRFTEDHGINHRHRGSASITAWDVSVFQQLDDDDPITIPYKIQVKSKSQRNGDHPAHYEYTDDISVVCPQEDLLVTHREAREQRINAGKILYQLRLDHEGEGNTPALKEILIRRSDTLLDLIDE